MIYYSHAKTVDGKRTPSKTLKVHTEGVRTTALTRLAPTVEYSGKYSGANASEFIAEVTALHDVGKLTRFFQNYLLDCSPLPPDRLKRHSLFGALIAWEALRKWSPHLRYAAAYLIAHHHRNLSRPYGEGNCPLFMENARAEEERTTALEQLATLPDPGVVREILGSENYNARLPTSEELQTLRRAGRAFSRNNRDLTTYLNTNYLFSLLVEADKLDASDTPLGESVGNWPTGAVSSRVASFGPPVGKLNELRQRARLEVIGEFEKSSDASCRFFTLTAPTGLGKTLTGLDVALRLCEKLQQARRGRSRTQLIVALPFISIIEQTLEEYRKVFAGTDVRVTGHYQFADVLGQVDSDSETKDPIEAYRRARMQLDTWQSDIVVTSFVQFFQSIATGRNGALMKFNHLAGAVVLLDEIQGLPARFAPFLGALLQEMTERLDLHVIMMTATQPLIVSQAQKLQAKAGSASDWTARELLPRFQDYFDAFSRTRLVVSLPEKISVAGSEGFVEFFMEKRQEADCALIVVNTVNRSLEIYALLDELATDIQLFYLSTNLLPYDRAIVLAEVRDALIHHRIAGGSPVVLVSTQVVEAGVDLDFDVGFRDMGPVPSLVQVAGRINRNHRVGRDGSPLYVTQIQGDREIDAAWVYDSREIAQTRAMLQRLATDGEIPESAYATLTRAYFEAIEAPAFTKSLNLYQSCRDLRYEDLEDFSLIERQNRTVTLFLERPAAQEALRAYQFLASAPVGREERRKMRDAFKAKYDRIFKEHLLTIPERYVPDLQGLEELSDTIKLIPASQISVRYDDRTGWIRDYREPLYTVL